jgi:hypothetical protein
VREVFVNTSPERVWFWRLERLLRRRRALSTALSRVERSSEELEQDRDLLERVAAGIALNKTPGR